MKCMGLGKHADRGSRRTGEFWGCLNLQGVPGSGHTTYSQRKHLGGVTKTSTRTVRLHWDKVHQYTYTGFCQLGCTKYTIYYIQIHLLFVELLQVC